MSCNSVVMQNHSMSCIESLLQEIQKQLIDLQNNVILLGK